MVASSPHLHDFELLSLAAGDSSQSDWETPRAAMITFSCSLRTHLALPGAATDSLEKQVMTSRLYNANLIDNNSKRKNRI